MAEIRRQGYREPDWRHKEALPLVSIEQFFEGNNDLYSIAANVDPHPPLDEIRATLEWIRGRDDVAEVLLEIYDIYDAERSDDAWPYSERVYVITTAGEGDAAEWNRQLYAQGPVEGWAFSAPPVEVPFGYRIWQIMWD